jgi:hypothetical protein
MMREPPNLARRAWASVMAAVLLWAFFDVTKHSPVVSAFAPFDVDPYDVVGSFSFQIAIAISSLTLVRLGLMRRQRRSDRLLYVSRGIAVVAACVAVTMASDTIAILRAGVHAPRSPVEAGLWAAIAGLALASAAMLGGLHTGPAGSSAAAGGGEFDWMFRRAMFRAIDPERHVFRFAAALALGLGVLATAAEVTIDGPAPTLRQTILVILVRIAIEACGVFLGILLLGRYLGLVAFSRRGAK